MTRDEVHLESNNLAHEHSIMDRHDLVQLMNGDSNLSFEHHLNNLHRKATNTTVQAIGTTNGIHTNTSNNVKLTTQNSNTGTLQSKTMRNCNLSSSVFEENQEEASSPPLSTIAILRRHTMYDSLILVKQSNLNGFSLGLPNSDAISRNCDNSADIKSNYCCRTKLVTVYLDGDDPIYQRQEENNKCRSQIEGEIVYVPVNGLLDRLDNYERRGVTVDSRVYAFAMGLHTAERFLTNSNMKEVQEAPPI